jgi:hypothetical protein
MKKNLFSTMFYCAVVAASLVFLTAWTEGPASGNITLTGTVSCSKCQGIQPLHKGYTRYTWALQSVSQGDDIVFVTGNDTYKLQGDKDQLLKYMEAKATLSGELAGHTLIVRTLSPVSKAK